MYDYLIIGAGISGLTFARILAEAGAKCLVLEKRKHIGGNCYTRKQSNIDIHEYGSHIFHTNDIGVRNFVKKFANWVPYKHNVVARDGNSVYQLPFNLMTMFQLFPQARTVDDVKQLIAFEIKQAELPAIPTNLEEQAISMVGTTIYEKLIKGYTTKQWGREPKDLRPEIIKRLPVRLNFNNTYFSNALFEAIPEKGYTSYFIELSNHENIHIEYGIDYLQNKNKWLSKLSPRKNDMPRILFTGGIDALCDFKFGKLEYRSLRFEHTELDFTDNFQGNPVINYPSIDHKFTRIHEHKHYMPREGQDTTIISYEYSEEYEPGKNDPYYPIGGEKNRKLYQQYLDYVEQNMPEYITGVGRLFAYKYIDMDVATRMAIDKAMLHGSKFE